LSNEVGLYVVLLEVLLFMPNSLIRHSKEYDLHTNTITCSTKELSIHLTKILSAVKEGQQKYCETVYSRSGINLMWILKNSKDLLDNLKSRSFSQVIGNSFVEQVDDPAVYLSLYGVLWSLGIQYK
jgi:hypothetical protein